MRPTGAQLVREVALGYFIRWRDDVERLRAWYRERGFLEARVRASRADERDGRVALTYRIDHGVWGGCSARERRRILRQRRLTAAR